MRKHPPPISDQPVLRLSKLRCVQGPFLAVRNVSLQVRRSEIAALLGPRGAGKSTLLAAISGDLAPVHGTVEFKGNPITAWDPAAVVQEGLIHVPEGRQVFPWLRVEDHLRLGAYTRADRDEVAHDLEAVYGYFPALQALASAHAGTLSSELRQMLAMGAALMAAPDLLLLDRPSRDLSPMHSQTLCDIVLRINRERGISILLAEQNAQWVLPICDYGYVLEHGRIATEGSGAQLRRNDVLSAVPH